MLKELEENNYLIREKVRDEYGSAKKIQDICKINSNIIYIEDFINEMDITTIAEYIKNVLKSNSKIVNQKAMSDDPRVRRPDISKAKQLLKWEPQVSFYEGIDKTVDYFKKKVGLYE